MKVMQVVNGEATLTPEAHGATTQGKRARPKTLNVNRLSKKALDEGAMDTSWYDRRAHAPTTYGECVSRGLGTRDPCPFVSCKHHLQLSVTEVGSIHFVWPDRDVDAMPGTCSLALGARGGMKLDEIAAHTNLTKEGVRRMLAKAVAKILARLMGVNVARVERLLRSARLSESAPWGMSPARKVARDAARSELWMMIRRAKLRLPPEQAALLAQLPAIVSAARAEDLDAGPPRDADGAQVSPIPRVVRCAPKADNFASYYTPKEPLNPMLDPRRYRRAG